MTQIIVLELDSGAPQAWVLTRGQPATDLVWPRGAQVHLLSYAHAPDALQLPAGRLYLGDETEAGRRLPEPLTAHVGVQTGGDIDWQPAPDAALQALKQLKVPAFDSNLCASFGGCSTDPAVSLCTLPCPAGTPPAKPELPHLGQIEGWQPVQIDGEPWMSPAGPPIYGPVEPAQLQCPPGHMHSLAEDACRPIRSCPATGQWPAQLPAGAIFVRADVNPGDGSPGRPFATLQAALQAADTSAPIVFEGEFDFGTQITTRPETIVDREIVGVCPQRSILTTDQAHMLTGGALHLEALTLVMGGELDLSSHRQQHRLHAVSVDNANFAVHYGDLTITDSRLRQTGPVALVAAHNATLRLERSHLQVEYAMHLYSNAALIIRDTLLETTLSTEGHGVSGLNFRSVDISGSIFRGFGGTAVGVSKVPSVRISDTQILGAGFSGINLQACLNRSLDCLSPGPGGFALTATISRTLVRSDATGIELAHGRLLVEDVVILEARGAVSLIGLGDEATDIRLNRVAARTVSRAGLRFDASEGIPKTLTLQDVYLSPAGGQNSSLSTAVRIQGFEVQIDRLLIDETLGHGLDLVCGGGQLNDVSIIGAQGVGLRLVPTHPIELSRATITAPEAFLVYPEDRSAIVGAGPCADAADNDPRLRAEDITIVGGPTARRGLIKCRGGQVHFERTSVFDFETGIHIHRGGISMNDTRIRARRFGVSVPALTDTSRDLLGMHFDGSGRAVEDRAERLDLCPQLETTGD